MLKVLKVFPTHSGSTDRHCKRNRMRKRAAGRSYCYTVCVLLGILEGADIQRGGSGSVPTQGYAGITSVTIREC